MFYKFTPLTIFLFLLTVLLICVFVMFSTSEGFISFNESTPSLNQLYIPQYSTTNFVYKLYDSVYYDPINGNVIDLFGTSSSNSDLSKNIIDISGSTLTDIVVISRPPSTATHMALNSYDCSKSITKVVDESVIQKDITYSYIYEFVPNSINFLNSKLSFTYQTLYISWGKDTLIHLYDFSNKHNVNIGTYLFRQSYDPIHYLYPGNLTTALSSYIEDKNENNNCFVQEKLYDLQKTLFQISANVLFDTSNRFLIIRDSGGISIYDGTIGNDGSPNYIRSTVPISGTPNKIDESKFSSFRVLYIPDSNTSNFVLYVPIPSTKKTVVAVICMDPSTSNLLVVRNLLIFNQNSSNGFDGKDKVIFPTKISTSDSAVYNGQNQNSASQSQNSTSQTQNSSGQTQNYNGQTQNYYGQIANQNYNGQTQNYNGQTQNYYGQTQNPNYNSQIQNPNYNSQSQNPNYTSQTQNYNGQNQNYNNQNIVFPSLNAIISEYYNKSWNVNQDGTRQFSKDFLLNTPNACPCISTSPADCNKCNNCKSSNWMIQSDYNKDNGNNNDVSNQADNDKKMEKYDEKEMEDKIKMDKHNEKEKEKEIRKEKVGDIKNAVVNVLKAPEREVGILLDKAYKSKAVTQTPTFEKRIVPEGPDLYSYYGKIPEKPTSDFISVSSDLNSFGR